MVVILLYLEYHINFWSLLKLANYKSVDSHPPSQHKSTIINNPRIEHARFIDRISKNPLQKSATIRIWIVTPLPGIWRSWRTDLFTLDPAILTSRHKRLSRRETDYRQIRGHSVQALSMHLRGSNTDTNSLSSSKRVIPIVESRCHRLGPLRCSIYRKASNLIWAINLFIMSHWFFFSLSPAVSIRSGGRQLRYRTP